MQMTQKKSLTIKNVAQILLKCRPIAEEQFQEILAQSRGTNSIKVRQMAGFSGKK